MNGELQEKFNELSRFIMRLKSEDVLGSAVTDLINENINECLRLAALPAPSKFATRNDYIRCPVCGDSDMLREFYGDEDDPLIYCTNHACASNGGENDSAIRSTPSSSQEPAVWMNPDTGTLIRAEERIQYEKFSGRMERKNPFTVPFYGRPQEDAPLLEAGMMMRTQLEALARDYRDAMAAKGGRNELHPLHEEALKAWDEAASKAEQK